RLGFRITRADGHRVEHAILIGTQKELPTRAAAREFVKTLYLPINNPAPNRCGRPVTFNDIAVHYIQEELPDDQNQASIPKAYSTTTTYKRYLAKWVLPRWGNQPALTIRPLDLENWLKELGKKRGLENQTRSKIRQVIGLVYKARPAGRISPSYGGGQSRPLRATVHDKQLRPDYFDADSGVRDHQPIGVDAAYAGAGKRCHRPTHFGDPGIAVEGHRLGRPMYLRPSGLCLREIRQAQIKGVEASRSSASRTRGSSAQLATRDAVRQGRRFGVSLLHAEGQKASERKYAVVRPSTSCSAQSWCCGPAPCIRVPHISANAGVSAGREQLRSKTGAGTTPALQHQNHSGHLCAGHHTGQAGGSGDVLGPIVKGLMDREKPSNEPHCLGDAFVLWAYCGLEQNECCDVSALKCGGQGRS